MDENVVEHLSKYIDDMLRPLSRSSYIGVCEELAADFQIRADAATEDQEREDKEAEEACGS